MLEETFSLQELVKPYHHQVLNVGSADYIEKVKTMVKDKFEKEGLSNCQFSGMASEWRQDVYSFVSRLVEIIFNPEKQQEMFIKISEGFINEKYI